MRPNRKFCPQIDRRKGVLSPRFTTKRNVIAECWDTRVERSRCFVYAFEVCSRNRFNKMVNIYILVSKYKSLFPFVIPCYMSIFIEIFSRFFLLFSISIRKILYLITLWFVFSLSLLLI